jgi:ATP-dependent exoDNAse (exonuclease V) alpha subunit
MAQLCIPRYVPAISGSALDQSRALGYLRRYWLHEQQVAQAILQRSASSQEVDESSASKWLGRLFDAKDKSAVEAKEMDWQKFACAIALRASLTVITGGPGTGKTYTAARLLALLFAMSDAPQRLRIALAAPTGKAAARLRQSIDVSLQELTARLGDELDLGSLTQRMGAARTLHSLLGARVDTREFRFNATNLLDVDILIVDEASMIHLEMMSALLQALAGQLLGAIHGAHAIPSSWIGPLELREVIEEVADDLATLNEWNLEDETSTNEVDFYFDRYPGW